jgi:hypothetical protein
VSSSVAAACHNDLLAELIGAACDARNLADRLHHATGDPALASAVRRLDEAAADLERVTLRPRLRLVRDE